MKQIKQWGRTLLLLALVIGLLWPTTAALADTKTCQCTFFVNGQERGKIDVPVGTKWADAKPLFEEKLYAGETVSKWEREDFLKIALKDEFELTNWLTGYRIYATATAISQPQQDYAITLRGESNTATATHRQAKKGTEVTVEAGQPQGKEFVEWKLHKGSTVDQFGDVKQPKVTFRMPNNEVILEAIYKDVSPADGHQITTLSLENLIAPMTGEKETMGHRVPVGAHYRIVTEKDSGWTDTVYNDMLKEGDVFKPFQVYKLTVYLQAEDGYSFAKDADGITKDFAKDPAKRIFHTGCTTMQDGKKFKFVIRFVTTDKEKKAKESTDPTPQPQEPQQDPSIPEERVYRFAEGESVQWKKGSTKGLMLTVDGVNMTAVQLIYERGHEEGDQPPVTLDKNLYTKKEVNGSTEIIIAAEHLQTLSEEKTYTVIADFPDGFGKTSLRIVKADPKPQPQPKAHWQQLTDGHWVYLKADGSRLKSAWKGDYYLKADGIMADNEWIYDKQYRAWYYLKADGRYARNTVIDGKYKVGADGKYIR